MSAVQETDVLIVGSGPVGSAFARFISERTKARILIVETGPQITPTAGRNVRNLAPQERLDAYARTKQSRAVPPVPTDLAPDAVVARAGTYLVDTHARMSGPGMPAAVVASNVGGMGALWTCACPRPADSEAISWIDAKIMDGAFAEAERVLSVTQQAFRSTAAGDYVREVLAERFDEGRAEHRRIQPMPLACKPTGGRLPVWSGADTVLGDLAEPEGRAAAGVEILAETHCRRLIVSGDKIEGVEVVDLRTNEVREIRARVVVVAADPLRTPQLLWASGIRPNALGRYLNDQPQVVSLIELRPDHDWERGDTNGLQDRRDAVTGVSWVPFDEGTSFPFHGQVMQLDASPVDVQLGPDMLGRPIVGFGLYLPKDIRAEDRIEFSEEAVDTLGMPAMTIRYGLTPADREHVAQAVEIINDVAGRLGRFVPGGEAKECPAGYSIHYQGSHRVGPSDDGTSVCDAESRVWGLSNLFLGGNGNIPTAIACNPTLTSVALASIASARIVADLESGRL